MKADSRKAATGLGFFMATGIVLNVFLPKGGFYVSDIPLTWGYLYLAPVFLWNFINIFFIGKLDVSRLMAFAACLPFLMIAIWTFAFQGVDGLGNTIALLVGFGFMPLLFFVVLDNALPQERTEACLRYAAGGFVYVAVFGIASFVVSAITHNSLDIPYISTGGGSTLTTLDRDNLRGDFFKLTSTFNNGNIYGVCAIMALPMVARFYSGWKANLLKLSLVLTLSRTAWAGLLLYEFGHAIWIARGRGVLLRSVAIIGMAVTSILIALFVVLQTSTDFLLDPTLGGRIDIFENLGQIYPLSLSTFDSIREIVYVSVLDKFGYLGLGAFLLAMFAPFVCRYAQNRPLDQTARSIMFSMMLYLALCWSDGAVLLIPVMFFYWGLASCLLAPASRTHSEYVGTNATAQAAA